MNVSDFVSRLSKARQTGNSRWVACCPAHADKHPSLIVSEGDDGRVLVHCFAGCAVADIVGAVGATLAELMPERLPNDRYRPIRRPFPAADVLACLRTESLIVLVTASHMARGGEVTPEAYQRLILAASRIEDAAVR